MKHTGKVLYAVPVTVYVRAMTKAGAKRLVHAGLSLVAHDPIVESEIKQVELPKEQR